MNSNVVDPEGLLGAVLLVHFDIVHFGENSETLVTNDLAEYSVHAIEMGSLVEQDEELRTVGAGALVGHGEHTAGVVFEGWLDLVLEGASPDGPTALRVFGGRVGGSSGLDHELGN